ncbi:TPA: hypothetical protein NUW79_003149 [Escherichia coli]|nr:hypothetical protein [Escherichia coli]
MTTPTINPDSEELELLMSQLEAETGVSAVAVPGAAPAPVAPAAVVVEDDELAALEALEEPVGVAVGAMEVPAGTVITSGVKADDSMFSAEELAEMEELEKISAASKPKADLSGLQGQLAGLKTGGVVTDPTPEEVLVDDKIPPTPDDELAALEAELVAEGTATPAPEPIPAAADATVTITINAEDAGDPAIAEAVAEAIAGGPAHGGSPAPAGTSATHIPSTKPKGLQFFIDPNEFKKETQVKDYNLDSCFMEQSSLRAHYGAMAARAEAQASTAKVKFEVLEARLYDHHRKILTDAGAKVTEKMVENAVKTDPRWMAGKENVIEAETIASVNKALAISLADRRDMLIQLGADRRDESKGQARLLAAQNERDSMTNRAEDAAKAAFGK